MPKRARHQDGRLAIYSRISNDRLLGAGVERHTAECRKYATRQGLTVDEADVFEDAGISASSFSRKPRPAYDRLCEGLDDGTYRGVIAYSAERLYRRLGDLESLIDLIEETGAEVHIVNAAGRIDLTTPPGRFSARAVAMAHALTEEMRAERIRLQRRQFAESGAPKRQNERDRAYGYGCDGVTIDEAEAATVRWMFERAAAGWTLGRIAREAPTPPRRTKVWGAVSVRSLLQNKRYIAKRVHKGEVVADGQWPALIDEATFDTAHAVLDAGRRPGSTNTRNRAGTLLSGILFDEHGWRMEGRGGHLGEKAIYVTNSTAQRAGSHRKVSVYRKLLDGHVIDEARAQAANLDAVDVKAPPSPEQAAADAIVAELAVLDEMVDAGELTAVEYRRRRAPKLAAYEAAKAAAPPPKRTMRAKDLLVFKRWDDLTWSARRDAIHGIVARVTVAAVAPGKFGRQPISNRVRIKFTL